MLRNKINLFMDFVQKKYHYEGLEKIWQPIFHDFWLTLKQIIHDEYVNISFDSDDSNLFDCFIYNKTNEMINKLQIDEAFVLRQLNEAEQKISHQCVTFICESIDVIINDEYIIKNTDNIKLLWFRFKKLFVPIFLIWDYKWYTLTMQDPDYKEINNKVYNEIEEFNELIKNYNILFREGNKFHSFCDNLPNYGIHRNDVIKLIDFCKKNKLKIENNNI